MSSTKETSQINRQRTLITEYLTAQILPNHISPRDRDSFYRRQPVEDPDYEEMFDRAQGDPTLYAILVAQHGAREDLEAAHADRGEAGPSAYYARPQKVEDAKEYLASMKLLEQQYLNPAEYPFEPGAHEHQ